MAETAAGGWLEPCRHGLGKDAAERSVDADDLTSQRRRLRGCAGLPRRRAALRRLVGAGFAAAFVNQADIADAHAFVGGLHHVIDGEGGDRDGGQRFHLDPGLAHQLAGGGDIDRVARSVQRQLDLDRGERQADGRGG